MSRLEVLDDQFSYVALFAVQVDLAAIRDLGNMKIFVEFTNVTRAAVALEPTDSAFVQLDASATQTQVWAAVGGTGWSVKQHAGAEFVDFAVLRRSSTAGEHRPNMPALHSEAPTPGPT